MTEKKRRAKTNHAHVRKHRAPRPGSTVSRVSLHHLAFGGVVACTLAAAFYTAFFLEFPTVYSADPPDADPPPTLDKRDYDERMLALAHVNAASTTLFAAPELLASTTTAATLTTAVHTASTSVSIPGSAWPAGALYPEAGALLPFNRIVAYYGNYYSKAMGVLGEYPEDTVLSMLASTSAAWEAADPSTPVIPAIQYIAVVAQGSAGADGKYRARMPDSEIQHALDMANKVNGILILDIQVGLSDLQTELPLLANWLALPNVHLAIDPEFATAPYGIPPGKVIGTMSDKDVNYAANFLANIVMQNNLPPKVLVIHRFTHDMLTGYENITPLPQVQVIVDMDGWGEPSKKIGTYTWVVAPEPVQFTGFKLFYKNDIKPPSTRLLMPREVLDLTPAPSYIQYQ